MALSRHHQAISKPMSVEELVGLAQQFEFSTNRPLKGWLRSAQMLLTEAAICEQDGDLQTAYLYLYRHAELVLGKLPQHPSFRDPKFKADITQAQKTVQRNLAKLEQWKPRIKQEHQRFVKAMERRTLERQRIQEERFKEANQTLPALSTKRDSMDSEDGLHRDSARALNVSENRQLAVDLAHEEIRRRDATRQSTRQAGISPHTVAARRKGIVLDTDEQARDTPNDNYGISDGIREAGRHLHRRSLQPPSQEPPSQQGTASTSYRYPSVPVKEGSMEWNFPQVSTRVESTVPKPPPKLPEKEAVEHWLSHASSNAPPLPPKARDSTVSTPTTATPSPPPVQQQPPSKYTFKPTAFTESGAPLRPVLLPPDLRTTFLNIAHSNTVRNLETCGILCGTLISNALFINHLIMPDQQSTSDTCDTTEDGDNDLFDYCDAHELLVCGWIHTHPTQSCFLSSPDLHTSSGYQVMLPEAIAIVCAPRSNPDWGVFRLTEPPGLKHILNCQQRSLFHPHSETNLYTDAIKPGHVVEGPGLKFEVVDLRKKWL